VFVVECVVGVLWVGWTRVYDVCVLVEEVVCVFDFIYFVHCVVDLMCLFLCW